mgnify:CR=1 FL=1
MVTAIRIKPKCWRRTVVFAAATIFLPAAYGADAEIYVTTGPDGIEIFSNLPRGRVMAPGKSANAMKSSAAVLVLHSALAPQSVTEVTIAQGIDAETPGKSFLLDD